MGEEPLGGASDAKARLTRAGPDLSACSTGCCACCSVAVRSLQQPGGIERRLERLLFTSIPCAWPKMSRKTRLICA